MNELPEISQGSISKGIWFIYNNGNQSIKVWSSSYNGNEKVFFKGELVSETPAGQKVRNQHKFKDSNGNEYEVKLIATKINKGIVECQFHKNQSLQKTIVAKYVSGKVFTLKRFVPIIVAAILFALLSSHYKLPTWSIAVLFVIIFIYNAITRDPGSFTFRDK